MNKQQLTKTFSFSKWLLFFFFAVGITLSSCGEDYDDDIASLNERLDKIGSYTDLTKNISDLQTALTQTSDATKDALAKAEGAEAAAAQSKLDAIADADAKLAALKADLESQISTGLTNAQIEEIVARVKTDLAPLQADIIKLVGHRVTSLVRIPTQTLNDEPAIIFRNITYVPQVFDGLHTAYTQNLVDGIGNGEVTLDAGARLFIDNQSTVVKYQVSPSISVKAADIEAPYFMGNVQYNTNMRSVSPDFAGKDMPIKVASWTLDEANGILSVNVTKNVPADQNINFEGQGTDTQKYYIASLHTIIPKADRTAEEVANNVTPEVASEYSRIAETTVTPMIKQVGSDAHPAHTTNYDRKELLNGKDLSGKYVHYHDSASLYQSYQGELIDHEVNWQEKVDLTKYVTVCEFENLFIKADGTANITVGSHATMEDYKAYGLEFRFTIPSTPYNLGDNKTDQQQFAVISNGSIMTSKVYDISGSTTTAVGRQPIVRVQLIDTRNNNNLVAQRYIKFLWTNKVEVKDIAVTFPQDTVTCKVNDNTVFTKQMNEDFYRQLSDNGYGLSKDEFHARYKTLEITSLLKDGVEILNGTDLTKKELDDSYANGNGITVAQSDAYAKTATDDQNAEDVIFAMAKDQNTSGMSYNLKWYMTPKAVGTIKDFQKSTYVLTVKFKEASGSGELIAKFTQNIIVPPQNFNFQDTYWEGAVGQVAKINPIVYDGLRDFQWVAPNPLVASDAWSTWNTGKDHYNHLGADLVKGYVNGITKLKPANLDEFIQYIRSCAKVRFEFDDTRFGNYAYLAGYTVTNDRQALWSNGQNPLSDSELQTYSHVGTEGDARYDKLAATIWNQFGATALENQRTDAKNLPWRFNETLGTGVDQASAQLWLSEISESDGSTAAINLVGKKVPVNLIVEYNEYNKVPVQTFEVKIIKPLDVTPTQPGSFTDAVANGSYINVATGVSYTDWNDYLASRTALTPPANVTADSETIKWLLSQKIWDFYQVRNVVFLTETAKTNLRLVGNSYTPVAGEINGNLPSGTVIKQIRTYDQINGGYTEVHSDPVYLRYFNDNGTPVNKTYEIYMNLSVRYKWGTEISTVTIPVIPAKGVEQN